MNELLLLPESDDRSSGRLGAVCTSSLEWEVGTGIENLSSRTGVGLCG